MKVIEQLLQPNKKFNKNWNFIGWASEASEILFLRYNENNLSFVSVCVCVTAVVTESLNQFIYEILHTGAK